MLSTAKFSLLPKRRMSSIVLDLNIRSKRMQVTLRNATYLLHVKKLGLQESCTARLSCHLQYASLPTSSACRLRSLPGRGNQSPRLFSSTAGDEKEVLIYTGAHAGVIRTLKRVSLTTCIIGLFSTPFFLTLGSESVPVAANVALTGIVLLATCGPTILLHAFTKPYIFALRVAPFVTADNVSEISDSGDKSDRAVRRNTTPDMHFSADTIDFLSRRITTSFNLSDVKPLPNSTRPFVSFSARDRLYFVHGETFPDKHLLHSLLGRPLKKSELERSEQPN